MGTLIICYGTEPGSAIAAANPLTGMLGRNMIIITDKSHAEYYRDRLTPQSAQQESELAKEFDHPDILPAVTGSFGSGLIGTFAAWLRKTAD